jgi:hypothetical protein
MGGMSKSIERNESDIVVVDPFTGEVKKKVHKPYPNHSAILTGLGRVAKATLVNTPELREMRNQTMLFVFGL